ncbi:hypothetical protein GIB67_027923 [Kingdonia uniflora]|uniref:Pentatricopeptide repeat-containing protein n=1 Tax=Kingdonia uniflora TaxID=39325 RepID=A0A7J7LGI1_9MAGN|nr:hypothetical protein GIB67_027923 [Kingdonia uniflora]
MNKITTITVNNISKITRQTKSTSLCNLGRLNEALQLLNSNPTPLNTSIYSPILQLCIDLKAEKEGRLLHNHLSKNGVDLDSCLNTKLIIFYGKIGDVVYARGVFDSMSNRSVVSWTAMISGYTQNGYLEEALRVFSMMRMSGVKANQFTYGSVLRACTSLGCLESGKQVQGCVMKSRFSWNVFVLSALVNLHSKCGVMEDARYLFEAMGEREVVCWNSMIGGYVVQGLVDNSFGLFRSMLNEGVMPDQFTFGSILKGCAGSRSLTAAYQIHVFVIHLGFQSHLAVTGSLIDAYVKCESVWSARLLYDSLLYKDLISCTSLITEYAREGTYNKEALDIFSEINQSGVKMDNVVLCSMLNICANIASLSLGRQIHAFAFKIQPDNDIAMGNALIDMYAKSGEIKDANRSFSEMHEKNVITWTSLISGYGKHGYGEEAVSLLGMMEDKGLKPNDVTLLTVLFACSQTGMIKEGQQCFSSMISEYKINPRAVHYSCMVDLLARGGQLEQAHDLICEMNVKPNASLWGAILGASRMYGNLSLGEVAAKHLFELEPDNSVNYVALASMYAANGLWEKAWKVRKLMEDRGVKKDPGSSFIQHTKEKFIFH